jgi:hypothetical protein
MRVKRGWMVAVTATLGLCMTAVPVAADTATLPGGTSLSVDITSPTEGAVLAPGAVTVTGTASVAAAAPQKNSTIVYAIDNSGSTGDSSGFDCDGVAGADSVLACEVASVDHVNTLAAGATSPVKNSGVAVFNGFGVALDVDPAAGTQHLTDPGPNISNAISNLTPFDGTSFVAGLTTANTILNDPAAQATKTLVFLSDGIDANGGTLPDVPAGTVVRAFAIGGANCGSTEGVTLSAIAAKGAPGSSCTQVTDLSMLDDVIGAQIGSSLTGLAISVNGGPATAIPNSQITPPLPQSGPATVSFSTSVTLANSTLPQSICVTATGSDAGGVGSASDCVNVQVTTTTANCTANCTLNTSDRNVSTATLQARNLPKTVGLRANPGGATDCGGLACVTGYDILWQGSSTTSGKIALTVHTNAKFAPKLKDAAVYFEGVKVTRSCISNIFDKPEQLPCKIILPDLKGGIIYFLKFGADAGARYR